MKLLQCCILLLAAWLPGCSPAPAPKSELLSWFENNQEVFTELKALGERHPALHRVEPAMTDFPSHHATLDADDIAAEQRITSLLQEIGADHVVYWRKGNTGSGELIAVSIPYYTWGTSLGGYAQTVEYVPNPTVLARLIGPGRKYEPLSTTGWYMHESDTR